MLQVILQSFISPVGWHNVRNAKMTHHIHVTCSICLAQIKHSYASLPRFCEVMIAFEVKTWGNKVLVGVKCPLLMFGRSASARRRNRRLIRFRFFSPLRKKKVEVSKENLALYAKGYPYFSVVFFLILPPRIKLNLNFDWISELKMRAVVVQYVP